MTAGKVRLTWHGHACFTIDNGQYVLVLDPYKPEMIGYPPLQISAHAMLASHQHEDHNYRAAVTFLPAPADLVVPVSPADPWPDGADPACFLVRSIEAFHDDAKGNKRGRNLIHVIRTSGLTIAHLGDLGHPLSEDQAKAIGPLDLLLLPVGGYYTIDADQAVQTIRQLSPRNVAPMHYQVGYGHLPIATVESFLEKISPLYRLHELGAPVLDLSPTDQNTCFVFKFKTGS
ncbi:MAG: MBL fold metallo-hydrolase [Bacillota bacterium]|nr:MBL fold metallo-hydrolase [Bacillota bacterium]